VTGLTPSDGGAGTAGWANEVAVASTKRRGEKIRAPIDIFVFIGVILESFTVKTRPEFSSGRVWEIIIQN
jgi:hypothetical protein